MIRWSVAVIVDHLSQSICSQLRWCFRSTVALPLRRRSKDKPWEKIPIPPLHEFKPQQPKRIELKNGIVIFLQEDHELPFRPVPC